MQQITAAAGQQGSQTGSGSAPSQTLRSCSGDPPLSSRTPSGRAKKRDRNEPASDSSKQQRLEKTRGISDIRDGAWKPEASSLVGQNGGLSSNASVERLLCIMRYQWGDSMQRPVDLIVSRTMLSKVVAATTEIDCLTRFLKLGGLSVLDLWLQEAYKWRFPADNSSPEAGDKAMEDLLLALLAALERLPVDLLALKTCSVGKSVNNLRSHKHQDIQRRARKLVDTWKKRVELEMNQSGDAAVPPTHIPPEQSICSQAQDLVPVSLKAQISNPVSYASPAETPSMGRGKFASVASLCLSPESLSRSTLIAASSTSPYSGSASHRVTLPTHSPLSSLDLATSQLLEHHGAADIERAAKFSSTHVIQHGSCTQTIAREGAGAARQRWHPPGKKTSMSSATTSLSRNEDVVPCSGSLHMRPEKACSNDATSRSTLNSTTVMDFQAKPPGCRQLESGKSGIQMPANVVASENSMNDAKTPDSPSERSFSTNRERSLPSGKGQQSCTELPGSGGISKDREDHEHISSNVSSPSETSIPVDNRLAEHGKVHQLAYPDAPSPADTTSQSSHPTALVGKHPGTKRGTSSLAMCRYGNLAAWSEDGKCYNCLPPALVTERVGESSYVGRAESRNRHANTLESGKVISTLVRPAGRGNALEAHREAAAGAEHAVANCHGSLPQSDSLDRHSSHHESAITAVATSKGSSDALALGNQRNKLKFRVSDAAARSNVGGSTSAEAMVSAQESNVHAPEMKSFQCVGQPKGFAFDLNEMVVDEGSDKSLALAGSVISEQVCANPTMSCSFPMPMAPIAVMAAANGTPSIPCRQPSGDLGWRGSAATSAFRPTQPRQSLEKLSVVMREQKGPQAKGSLDFDLNVAIFSMEDDDMAAKEDSLSALKPCANMESTDVKNGARFCGGAGLDLNRMDVFTATGMEFDLNRGPIPQGVDDAVMPGKHLGVRDPSFASATAANNTSGAYTFPAHPPITPLSSPVTLPVYASSNLDRGYAAASTVDSAVNSAAHLDSGMFPYNIFMHNQIPLPPHGIAAYPSSNSYGSFPSGFFAASLQGSTTPFLDRHRPPPAGATTLSTPALNGSEVLVHPQVMVPLQLKPPYIMGVSSDAIRQANSGF